MSSAPSLRTGLPSARPYCMERGDPPTQRSARMSPRSCLVLGLLAGLAGLSLRLALPVTPVDQDFRDVIAFYRSLGPGQAH
ncbi:hypothetical protein [Methylobacterium crusticola]|nr:hypothetical protein [Methylobacterium crusticola]